MPPRGKFSEGERVLCYHGNFIYEAKCVKADVKDKSVRYFIHYNGWNKSWDEWVPEARVLKYNETGLQKQRELKKAHETKVKSAKASKNKRADKEKDKDKEVDREHERAATPSSDVNTPSSGQSSKRRNAAATPVNTAIVTTSETDPPKKKRSRNDPTVETEENYMTKVEIKLKIPEDLKPWLVDDWDLITRQKQLVRLPAKTSVDTILEDYVKGKLAKGNYAHKDAIVEVTRGIREYFNIMLGTQLLYKFERPQYAEILAERPDTPVSQIYGAIHLLRLFVKLGNMLAYTQLDERSVQLLMTHLQDVLKYFTKQAYNLLHLSDYIVATPEYLRKAL
ncbi:hypothetical protein LSH36_295g03084 [Paralvinella palmiformis]|uniref:Mortality factor 4-like protein 1 n=1 Tax=Paralvinella palmiformis TaxID=53620 RepID=A0AAD9JIT0_9ANNE|nr:hypothetical protein LSH36_295g03084 [Paralvinella palmiformis]